MGRPTTIELGYVARAHGIKGELRFQLYSLESETLNAVEQVELRPREGKPVSLKLRSVRASQGGAWLVVLDGVTSRERADALVGATVHVPRASLPPLEEGEYYQCDLIGLKVKDLEGREVGTLEEVLSLPANDVYVVRGGALGEVMVPAVAAYLDHIDLEAGVMVVKGVEDLLGS